MGEMVPKNICFWHKDKSFWLLANLTKIGIEKSGFFVYNVLVAVFYTVLAIGRRITYYEYCKEHSQYLPAGS